MSIYLCLKKKFKLIILGYYRNSWRYPMIVKKNFLKSQQSFELKDVVYGFIKNTNM